MSDEDIGFNKDFPLKPGVVEEVVPGLRRILCNNPGPFSFTGHALLHRRQGQGRGHRSGTGRRDAREGHSRRGARRNGHAHLRHPHAHGPFAEHAAHQGATGAKVYADGNPLISRFVVEGEKRTSEAGGDTSFVADVKLADGQVVEGDGWSMQAVATPGHASNHMAFAWREKKILFSGDHVMGWSTSIVSPPDGSMIDYMASLEKLLLRDEDLYFCGHGPQVPEAKRYVRFLQRHRKAREESILHRLAKGPCDIPTIVRASYIGIDPRLVPAAGRSVFAHLEDLVARKVVATDGEPSIDGTYRLV